MTSSAQKERANAAIDGRGGRKAAYTGGARTSEPIVDRRGYNTSEQNFQRNAWAEGRNVQTFTSTRAGRLSANGQNTKGAYTNAMTPKNDDGTPVLGKDGKVRQSGRTTKANRRQRDYDVRAGLNNITPKAMEAMIRTGQVQVVDGSMIGSGGNVIRQKANGNYTMGLTTG